MIADFPDAKKQIRKFLDAALRIKVKQKAPTWSLGSRKTLFEGSALSVIDLDGRKRMSEIMRAESTFTISREQIPTTSMEEMLAKMDVAAEDMAGQIERGFFKTMTDATNESGNWLPGNPRLTPDGILTGLEAVAVDFEDDDREKPVRPTIIASPEAVQELLKLGAAQTLEEKKMYEVKEKEIYDRKYREHMADLASRKIID